MSGPLSWTLADFRRHVPRIVAERDEWRARAEQAEARLENVEALLDEWLHITEYADASAQLCAALNTLP